MFKSVVKKFSVVVVALIFGYVLGFVSNTSSLAAKKIEYRIIGLGYQTSVKEREAIFNRMGADGWEFVEGHRQPTAVFKR